MNGFTTTTVILLSFMTCTSEPFSRKDSLVAGFLVAMCANVVGG